MATVVISSYNVASFPEGGGHFWVYLQYVLGLRQAGCEVFWLERLQKRANRGPEAAAVATFLERVKRFGLERNALLYSSPEEKTNGEGPFQFLTVASSEAERIFRRTDLLLNFHYAISPALVARFRRTALVDIDPGLLQFWMATGQLQVPQHDLYFTTGETVGTTRATFPLAESSMNSAVRVPF